ncbi:MAG: hypothetical protein IKU00_10520 [Bacteroidales bacterium]|nr:hypothetical protein [Bacteroidales bacterium]MBR4148296.1 hypothetical protein [Bacteroidales bacterium]
MLNYQDYDEDFRRLGIDENEQKVVLDFFHQLGEILLYNNIEKPINDGLETETEEERSKAS